jgi:RNA polymerase sigma-70 factor (ECF subfamily)
VTAERQGDLARRRARFEALYDAHYETVRRYLFRRTSADDVDDLIAETFLVAWRKIDEVPGHEAGWLCCIARNLLFNDRRAIQRRDVALQRSAHEVARARAGEEIPLDTTDEVIAALNRLSEGDREVLMLTAWDGLSGAEAARAMDCTRAVYNVRLFRARRRFAQQLASQSAPAQARTTEEIAYGR